MKKDLCEIVLVLDESGSMGSCKSDNIGGVNEFINTQRTGDTAYRKVYQYRHKPFFV
jgi:hypothetical protein